MRTHLAMAGISHGINPITCDAKLGTEAVNREKRYTECHMIKVRQTHKHSPPEQEKLRQQHLQHPLDEGYIED